MDVSPIAMSVSSKEEKALPAPMRTTECKGSVIANSAATASSAVTAALCRSGEHEEESPTRCLTFGHMPLGGRRARRGTIRAGDHAGKDGRQPVKQ
eukprot:scaffold12001_cov116-Isochrysis_galbana.AAC.12